MLNSIMIDRYEMEPIVDFNNHDENMVERIVVHKNTFALNLLSNQK